MTDGNGNPDTNQTPKSLRPAPERTGVEDPPAPAPKDKPPARQGKVNVTVSAVTTEQNP